MFETHVDIIGKRWPAIASELMSITKPGLFVDVKEHTLVINQIQLTSNVDRNKEAQLQTSLIPQESGLAHIFGTGLGDCQEILLKRENLSKLHVVILNVEVFWCSLNVTDQTSWLSDDRVELHTSESVPDVVFPFLALPSEMSLCDNRSAQLRDRIAIELNHQFVSKRFQSEAEFSQRMMQNLSFVRQDPPISALALNNVTDIFVCGAGPTLADHLAWLKKHRPFLIAVDASINTLLTNGIVPNIVVSIDHTSSKLFEDSAYHQLKDTALVYFPNSDGDLLTRWQGQRYASYSDTPMYAEVKKHASLEPLFSAGSVIHPSVDLAKMLGAKKIRLLGTDFSFVYGKSHAKGNENSYEQSAEIATQWVVNGLGQRVPTMANLRSYLRDLERYIEKNPDIQFINGSEKGAKIEGTSIWQI